jgi:putative tryptophan/tyrosine transport system substrate-binding protein
MMERRDFLTLLGGASAAWPLRARAQQTDLPVIAVVNSASRDTYAHAVSSFQQGLASTGVIDGRNAATEFHWAEGRYDKLPALMADLIGRKVAVIAAFGPPAAIAAKATTASVPIVFTSGIDPVKLGLAASFHRPGGNSTGIHLFNIALEAKRLALIREVVPNSRVIAFLASLKYPGTETQISNVKAAARDLGQDIRVFSAGNANEITDAFAELSRSRADVLLIGADPFFNSRRDQLVALAADHRIPTVYNWREFVAGGGLMSYGVSYAEVSWQAGVYAGKILKGEKPADLPVVQPTKFELVVNLKTSKALGLDLPPTVLAIADEAIE